MTKTHEDTILVDVVHEREGMSGNRPWRCFTVNREYSTFDAAIGQKARDLRGFWAVIKWRHSGRLRTFKTIIELRRYEL